MIEITERAAKKISKHLALRGKGMGVRVGVRTTGCSGLAYLLEFVDDTTDGDNVVESQGVSIIVDQKSLVYVNGLTVDYVRKGLNEGFEFINPNEKARCGCGESFTV